MDDTLRKPEILIVDDNVWSLEYLSMILKAKGYKIRTLSNALHLLDILEESQPNLILLDVMMPGKSGYELCSYLKQEKRFCEIPVIFLTALDDSESIIRCFQVGAVDYLSKPVNVQELFARIETHLNLKNSTEKLREAQKEIYSFNQMISHDLKTPILMLKKLACYLEDYKDKTQDPDYEEIILGIRQKAEEITYVMEKYSELSKLSCTKLRIEPVDLNELFREIFYENSASEAVVIQMEHLPIIKGDRLLLKCAFANAVANALKFSRNSHPPIIQIGSRKSDSSFLLYIKDNGVGCNLNGFINPFEMFTRLHSQADFEGTGTGLAIVKKIIDLHEGKVWLKSEENKGATIYFEFAEEAIL